MRNKRNLETGPDPEKLQFLLTLDPATNGDQDTVAALLDVFPAPVRPRVGLAVQLTESVGGTIALLTFTVTVIAPASKWFAKKVLGPPLEEIGEWLRDLVKEFRKRRKTAPPSVTLHLELQSDGQSIRIGVPQSMLADPRISFTALGALLAEVLPHPNFRNTQRVMLSWDAARESWVFTIWPKNMHTTNEYLTYDPKTGAYEKRHL